MDRREFISRSFVCGTLFLVSGCSTDQPNQNETDIPTDNTDESSNTETTSGSTPTVDTMTLEIVNLSSEDAPLHVNLTEDMSEEEAPGTKEELYSKNISLSPREKLNLEEYRRGKAMNLIVELNDEVIFDEQVETHEGVSIEILSESEINIEREVR